MVMPASDSCGAETQPNDCMPDNSDASKEFNRNFNQSLLGLKALSSQSGSEISLGELLTCSMEKRDDDVVILDDTSAPNILHKNGNGIDTKTNKFTINDNIRNVFKGIMSNVKNVDVSKAQENDNNTLPKLLAQTRSIGLESRTTGVLKNNTQNGDKCPGNNLFENLKDIHGSPETQECNNDTQSGTHNATTQPKPDVIELDDSLEDDLLKSNGSSVEQNCESKDEKELDKKEEDKLLQIDSDVVDLSDNVNQDDLKLENKLLELDNENSNQSVTSVKSNHSVHSNHSAKSNQSVKSDASIHSVKSTESEKSNNSHKIISETTINSLESTDSHTEKSDSLLNHSDSSNHSIKSDTNVQSVKSDTCNHSSKSISHNSDSEKSSHSINSDKSNHHSSNHSDKSDSFDQNDDLNSKGLNNTNNTNLLLNKLESENHEKGVSENKNNEDDMQEDISQETNLSDNSKASKDSASQSSVSSESKEEKMEVDSGDEKEESKHSPDFSNNKSENEDFSIKPEDCDTKSSDKDCLENSTEDNGENEIQNDRKRPAESDDLVSTLPKRSRLDEVIGKLGSQIGIPLDKVKTIDELSDTDASHMDSELTESKSEETSSDTDVDDDEDDEDIRKMDSPLKSPKKSRRVSQKELQMIVKARVMLYLRTYRDETIRDLHRKIDDLQNTNDMWKNKAKDLERKMLELTVLQQKHEKRKAKTAALRQISCKSIGVQVDENKVEKPLLGSPTHVVSKEKAQQQSNNQTTPNKNGTKTPPRSSAAPVTPTTPRTTATPMIQSPPTITLPSTVTQFIPITSLAPQGTTYNVTNQSPIQQALNNVPMQKILISPPPATTQKPLLHLDQSAGQYPSSKTVKSLLDSSRQQQKTVTNTTTMLFPSTAISKVGQLQQPQFIMVTSAPSIPISTAAKTNIPTTAVSNVTKAPAKVIDLTDEEETAAKQAAPQVAKLTAIPSVVSTIPSLPQGLNIRNLTPQPGALAQQSILLSGPAGTRFVNPPPQQYQLVFNSGAPNIRPGSLVTVVSAPTAPGLRPSAVTQTNIPPPQLRAAQLVPLTTALPRTNAPITTAVLQQPIMRAVRPPPPLHSAPSNQNNAVRTQLPPKTTQVVTPPSAPKGSHPAPLPLQESPAIKPGEKPLAPKPTLKISRVSQGIVLSWNMTYIAKNHAEIQSYQLFAYQETAAPPTPVLWKKVGDVKALPLPMACTLTQFQEGNRYHFAVRPVDVHGRPGPFSEPSTIHLMPMK